MGEQSQALSTVEVPTSPKLLVGSELLTLAYGGFFVAGSILVSLQHGVALGAFILSQLLFINDFRHRFRILLLPESHHPLVPEHCSLEELAEAHRAWAAFARAHPCGETRACRVAEMKRARLEARQRILGDHESAPKATLSKRLVSRS